MPFNTDFSKSNSISVGDQLPCCKVPTDKVKSDPIKKVKCEDPLHSPSDSEIREGQQVYAILSHNADEQSFVIEYISCVNCSAQSIYEKTDKQESLYIVSGTISPEGEYMKLTSVTVLDYYHPD